MISAIGIAGSPRKNGNSTTLLGKNGDRPEVEVRFLILMPEQWMKVGGWEIHDDVF